MNEWQDITSAPNNKPVLVCYKNRLDKWRVVIGIFYTEGMLLNDWDFYDDEFAPAGWYEETESDEHIYPLAGQPTHWQPLPKPPTGE